MKRRDWIKLSAITGIGLTFAQRTIARSVYHSFPQNELNSDDFGPNFIWGAACAAYQVEGAWNQDGKGKSIWDTFTHKRGNIHNNQNGDQACGFYHNYEEDIALAASLNLDVFRFSISWSRIFPSGEKTINPDGVQFYHNVINTCHSYNIEPWITLYHWDLPQALQDKGGWTNRDILKWFSQYVDFCTKEYGTKVKNWMVMNEPAAFVGLGYMLGYHAPGEKGPLNFLKASHHACLAMADGGRIIRTNVEGANVGTTFSCSHVDTHKGKPRHAKAVRRIDALVNRLYIEPSLGLGYPYDGFPALKKIENYFEEGDEERLIFDFDFIGLQNYFRIVGKKSVWPPLVWAKEVPAKKRDVPMNEMDFEVYPEGMYKILKQFAEYKQIKKIIITENGVCYEDHLQDGKVHDSKRIQFYKDYLKNILKAKNEGVPVDGYLVWSLTDNFEWSEGYEPRFGLIYIDFATQKRYIKDSGLWFKKFLEH
ncbi:MAG TPA: beta-glucosidase [Flavobacteriales bacterium]|nr:beta-glucosidase [Flavobacteriales bacterium]